MSGTDYRPLLKNALTELRELRAKLDAQTSARRDEPIAIVGMGCRFPGGANGPDAFWKLLAEGRDAITEVPKDRWDIDAWYDRDPTVPNKMISRWGGFIDDIDQFDRAFFGISAREAASLDPQQRMLLETAWEALEDAGQSADALRGTATGVFLGAYATGYSEILGAAGVPADAYMATGNGLSFTAGRLAYTLDLQGPALTLDTACSSSLVAIDLACQSLRRRQCDVALAGGVNVILTPTLTVILSKLFALSPTGRCRTFDAAADGFVRGEGCGLVVLKRVSDAMAAGDDVLAVIRASAVNQDGNGTGLTAPNALAQQSLLRAALREAGINAADVGMIEAHGTGTPLGDPIELDALKEVLGAPRADRRLCAVSSVKTNIGHLEAAAGVAGLIKAVLCLRNRQIPRHLHIKTLNPNISLEGTPFVIPTELRPWEEPTGRRIAGLSSFGISGTNAHIIIEEAPARDPGQTPLPDGRAHVVPVSARSPESLRLLAQRYAGWLRSAEGSSVADVAHSAGVRRAGHRHRLAVVGSTSTELAEQLETFARGERRRGTTAGESRIGARSRIAFVYAGQGAQWVGMGQALCEEPGEFRDSLETVDAVVREEAGWSVIDELRRPEGQSRLAETEIIQPVLLALQLALTALWRSWGIEPDVVVGHSVGEIAAAHVAGALSLGDAVRVAIQRAQIMQRAGGLGRMVAVDLSWDDAQRAIRGFREQVSVAAHNGPRATVLSGDPAAIAKLTALLEQRRVTCRALRGDYAFHSPQMEPYKPELARALGGISPRPSTRPILSTVTGRVATPSDFDAAYWARNIREPVLFAPAMAALIADGISVFLEISPHPVLSHPMAQCVEAASQTQTVAIAHSLRRDKNDRDELLAELGGLWTQGLAVDWRKQHAGARVHLRLPTYAWQRERCWVEAQPAQSGAATTTATASVTDRAVHHHPLMGRALSSSLHAGTRLWESELGADAPPYLADHLVEGTPLVPAAAYLEMATQAAAELFGPGAHEVEEVQFREMLLLPREGRRAVQVVVSPVMGDRMAFQIASLALGPAAPQAPWIVHAEGILRRAAAEPAPPAAAEPLAEVRARCAEVVDGDPFYQAMRASGLEYGPRFQTVRTIWRRDGEAIAALAAHPSSIEEAGRYSLHPAILDGCFQVLAAAAARSGDGETHLPVSLRRLRVFGRPSGSLVAHATFRPSGAPGDDGAPEGDVVLCNDDGQVFAEARGLRSQRIGRARDEIADWLYTTAWEPQARPTMLPGQGEPASWLILADQGGAARGLANHLERLGDRCVVVNEPSNLADTLRGDAFGPGRGCRGIICLAGLDRPRSEQTGDVLESGRAGHDAVLAALRAIASVTWRDPPRLTVVTSATQPIGAGGDVSVAHAGLWGFVRTLAHEHPELRPTCIDIDIGGSSDEGQTAALADEIRADADEDQVALRRSEHGAQPGVQRYVARLMRWAPGETDGPEPTVPAEGRSFGLSIDHPGVLERLQFRERERRPPARGEVEIEVHATGLNFLDVLLALGVLSEGGPGAGARGGRLGAECSGTIVALGPGVSDLKIGDDVIAIGASCFASHVTVPSALTVPKPSRLSMVEAASIPVTFLTAYIALLEVGRLAKGERVLIHAAAGGVGMAAVQIARHAGAEIFATAGSEEKRALLRSIGVRHVMDSRSLDFVEATRAATGGEGVDVVLNSLAGEFIPRSLGLLRDYGRFLEIGKRDYLADHKLGLRPFLKNLSFSLVDVGAMMHHQHDRLRSALLQVLDLIGRGALALPPLRVFPASESAEAFRHMAQAKHIGKIVVSMKDAPARITPARPKAAAVGGEGTYLVTGGLGGLGLEVARWMVGRGARHLVLLGRNAPTASARGVIEQLAAAGADVVVETADVSREADVSRVLAQIARSPHALRGIVHAAGVLNDGVALEQTADRFAMVIAPKAGGAWNLHLATRHQPLDFFVLFSSAAGVLGSPGQSNYAAANAFLDALAHHRRAAGLPALSIDWGAWTKVGMAAAQANRGDRLAARGMAGIAPEKGVAVLGRLLAAQEAQVTVVPISARQWQHFSAQTSGRPFLARLVEETAGKPKETATKKELFAIESLPSRRMFLESRLRIEVANVLRIDPAGVDPQKPLRELGIDSLMAIELRNVLEATFGVGLPSTVVWNCPTVSALGQELARKMDLALEARESEPAVSASAPHAAVAALQDDDVIAKLLAVAEDLSPDAIRSAIQAGDVLPRGGEPSSS